ncbi:hypothetical protein, partial [Xanthomonas citri]
RRSNEKWVRFKSALTPVLHIGMAFQVLDELTARSIIVAAFFVQVPSYDVDSHCASSQIKLLRIFVSTSRR